VPSVEVGVEMELKPEIAGLYRTASLPQLADRIDHITQVCEAGDELRMSVGELDEAIQDAHQLIQELQARDKDGFVERVQTMTDKMQMTVAQIRGDVVETNVGTEPVAPLEGGALIRAAASPGLCIKPKGKLCFCEEHSATEEDSKFKLQAGNLTSQGVSFEAVAKPTHFLRRYGVNLMLEHRRGAGGALFNLDSTFTIHREGVAAGAGTQVILHPTEAPEECLCLVDDQIRVQPCEGDSADSLWTIDGEDLMEPEELPLLNPSDAAQELMALKVDIGSELQLCFKTSGEPKSIPEIHQEIADVTSGLKAPPSTRFGMVPANGTITTSTLSDASMQLDRLTTVFCRHDRKGTGSLDDSEMARLFTQLHSDCGKLARADVVEADVKKAMKDWDLDGSGEITLSEFVSMYANSDTFALPDIEASSTVKQVLAEAATVLEQSLENQIVVEARATLNRLTQLFSAADVDGSGALDIQELAMVFKVLYKDMGTSRRLNLVEHEVSSAMEKFDHNASGTLELGEFVSMYALAENFKLRKKKGDAEMRIILANAGDTMQQQHKKRVAASAIQGSLLGKHARTTISDLHAKHNAAEVVQGALRGKGRRKSIAETLEWQQSCWSANDPDYKERAEAAERRAAEAEAKLKVAEARAAALHEIVERISPDSATAQSYAGLQLKEGDLDT